MLKLDHKAEFFVSNKESSEDASNVLIMPKGKSVAIIKFIALGKVFLENEKGADRRTHFPKIF